MVNESPQFSDLEPKAMFNDGIASVYRIDTILKSLDFVTARRGEVKTLNQAMHLGKQNLLLLISFYKEISSSIKSKTNKDYHLMVYCHIKEELDNAVKGNNKINLNFFHLMDLWEIELREAQKKSGLGMPDGEDYRYALGNK